MANDYGQLYHSFWTDPKVRRLTADQRLLLAYFFSSPHSNMAGLYVNPQAYAAHETGLPLPAVQAAMGEPLSGFLSWDGETSEVLVFRMARRQVGPRILFEDKRWVHIHGIVLGAHSARLRQQWYDLHRDWVIGLKVPFPRSSSPLGRALVEGDSGSATPLAKGDQELDEAADVPSGGGSEAETGASQPPSKPRTEQEQEQNRTQARAAAEAVPAATAATEFEAIRSQLPAAYQPAFEELYRRAPNCRGFCWELRALQTAMPGHGPGYPWEIIGHALHDIWVTGAPVSPRAIRRFCEDLVTGKSAPAAAVDGVTEFSALLAAERAKTAKAAAP